MAADDICFLFSKAVALRSVFQSCLRMAYAMPVGTHLRLLESIEIIIVEHGAPGQRFFINIDPQFFSNAETDISYVFNMLKCGISIVHRERGHLLYLRIFLQEPDLFIKNASVIVYFSLLHKACSACRS